MVSPQMLKGMETSEIYHWWRNYCEENRYDYMDHVKFTEAVESVGKLPASMMLLAPCSNNPDIWTDIVRIATLNTELSRKTTESHVCPLQTDVCERLIERYSNPGDTILDPFGGIHTVPYVAIGMGRKGIGIELNPNYWRFGVTFCERADREIAAPTLFDMLEDEEVTV